MDQIEALDREWKGIWRHGALGGPEPRRLRPLPLEDPPGPPEPRVLRQVLWQFKRRTAVGA
eukprot:3111737-Pyramimonas_sp.AAC.1